MHGVYIKAKHLLMLYLKVDRVRVFDGKKTIWCKTIRCRCKWCKASTSLLDKGINGIIVGKACVVRSKRKNLIIVSVEGRQASFGSAVGVFFQSIVGGISQYVITVM